MVFKIPLPTDNFYKMIFYLGLTLFSVSFVPTRHIHKLNIGIIRLTGEVEELEMRKKWLNSDYESYRKGVEYLEKYKLWEQKPIQALNPGTEEAKMFTEMTGCIIEPNIAEAVISLDSMQEIEEKKEGAIKEIKSSLDQFSNELKITDRELKSNETKLKTKDRELFETKQFLESVNVFAHVVRVAGLIILFVGGYKWFTITQRCENMVLENQSRE